MTIKTVNVIEIVNCEVAQVVAFPDTKEGNDKAQKLFLQIGKENGMKKSQQKGCLNNGSFSTADADYVLFLAHSV